MRKRLIVITMLFMMTSLYVLNSKQSIIYHVAGNDGIIDWHSYKQR